jgi:hypothetical protein
MARALLTGVATAGGVVLGSAGAYAAIVRPKSAVFLASAHLMGCALHCMWLDSYGYLNVLSAAKAEFLYECKCAIGPGPQLT